MRVRDTIVPVLVVGIAGIGGWLLHGMLAPAAAPAHAEEGEHEADASETLVEVTTAPASVGSIAVTIPAFGVVRTADGEVSVISSRAGGRVATLLVRTGDTVKKGAPVLRFETAPLELALTQAKASELVAENQLAEFDRTGRARKVADLTSVKDQAKVDLQLALAQVTRLDKLKGDGLYEKALADAERTAGAARRDLESAERALDAFQTTEADLQRSTLVSARDAAAAVVQDTDAILRAAEVLAPADGRLLGIAVRPGDRVEAGAELATLLRGDAREIGFGLLARDAAAVTEGTPVTWIDRGGAGRTAHVRSVLPRVEAGLGLVDVLVVPDDGGTTAFPGEIVRGEIESRKIAKAILVPTRAIVRAEDETTVAVVKDDVAKRVVVRVLAQHGDQTAIEGEVAAGDRVVVEGAYNLPDGAHVRTASGDASHGAEKEPATEPAMDSADRRAAMNIVPFAHRHRRALFVLLGLAVAAGIHATATSGRSIYPGVTFPRIAVIAERGESPVRTMLVSVTQPLEQAVSATPGLLRVRSKTVRGASELSLDFEGATVMESALSLVRARVAQAGLPADVHSTIEQQTPAVFPVLSFNVIPGAHAKSDPVARARLAEWAETELKPRLARLPDAFFVSVQSGDRREYVFEADPARLAQSGVSIREVDDSIRNANVVTAAGRSGKEGLGYEILVDGQFADADRILDVAVPREGGTAVPLRDLGRVVETTAERTIIVTGGGRDGVVVSVFLRDGGKVTRLSTDVSALLGDVADRVPGNGLIERVYDQAQLVNLAIDGVRDAILLGAALAVVILAAFLASWRLTVVAGLSIPLSILLTIALFPLVGETLNLMSLGGLAVAVGLVIDDAIVVCENVARRLRLGPSDARACVADSTREVFGAVVGSSLTSVMVFAPLGLFEGAIGQFFRSLSLALGIAVLMSMVVSLVYSPLFLLIPGLTPRAGGRRGSWTDGLQRGYAWILARLLRHPKAVALALVVAALAGSTGLSSIETGFLPEMDEGGLVLDYALPVGSSIEETDAACRRIERVVLSTPEVASLSRRTGAELGFFATEPFTGDMLVGLKPLDARRRTVFQVIDELRARLSKEVPQAECEFIQVMQDTIADLAGNPEPIEVKVLGSDYALLQRTADRIEKAIEHVSGVVDVKNHVSFGSPALVWSVDPAAAARLGLSTSDVADQVTAQLLGEVVTGIPQSNRIVDIRVRYGSPWRSALDSPMGERPLFVVPSGSRTPARVVPLAGVATLNRTIGEHELERENQTPMVRVTASVAGRDLGSAERAVERAVARVPMGTGVRVEFGGQARSQKDAFANLATVFGLALGLVFLLLVVQFRSVRLSLVIMFALPFGQLGALHALESRHVALNVSSGMGLILLVGLVVKNGIILIEYARQLRAEGHGEIEAIVEAARVRLRPILMTTLAAIAGLLPLAMGIGAGAELQRPLAIAVVGGLAVSTVFTLIAIPVGCALIGRRGLGEGAPP